MKIYVFEFNNYFAGNREFKVLANNRDEAWNLLIADKSIKHYINDEETSYPAKESEIEIDTPRIISCL